MKFKIFCRTDNKWEEVESLLPPTTCPVNSEHVVVNDSTHGEGLVDNKDFITLRNELMVHVDTIGFSNLPVEHKIITAANFCVGPSDRSTVLTEEEQRLYWTKFLENTKIARTQRWEKAKDYISYELLTVDSIDLAKSTNSLSELWKIYGDLELLDWLQGTGNYLTTGFPSKTYWTQEYQDYIISILNN